MKKNDSTVMRRMDAWIMLLLGLLAGIVYFLDARDCAPIAPQDMHFATGVYSAHWESKSRRQILDSIKIRLEENETLKIDSACASVELRDALRAVEPGTRLYMLVRPNDGLIVELRAGERLLLDAQTATQMLREKWIGRLLLGALCSAVAVAGLIRLLTGRNTSP